MLNAFRHHRLFHQDFELVLSSAQSVLNAFRHHRLFHEEVENLNGFLGMCSTPFGITDYSTVRHEDHDDTRHSVLNAFRHHRLFHKRSERVLNVERHVLNAFRHHRLFHRAITSCLTWNVSRCSTPFGTTDYSTDHP